MPEPETGSTAYQNQRKDALILRRLPPSLSIDSAQTPTSRPLNLQEQSALKLLNQLKEFLATAPTRWSPPDAPGTVPFPNPQQRPALNRFLLPSGEYVTCVLWEGLYRISGTDIVRALVFRFEAFGRPVRNMKKFEEGVFSDLRNLKPGVDACLEEPKSALLDLLYKYHCVRTQKKQKIFYWFSVPHDRLFLDALERDLKRENIGLESSTKLAGEPAASFKYNASSAKTLWEEWVEKVKETDLQNKRRSPQLEDLAASTSNSDVHPGASGQDVAMPVKPRTLLRSTSLASISSAASSSASFGTDDDIIQPVPEGKFWPGMLELFEGSPAYKQRRKRRGPGQSRIGTKDKDRARGIRKGSKEVDEDRDPAESASRLGVELSRSAFHAQDEMEMARRELIESLIQSASFSPTIAESPPPSDPRPLPYQSTTQPTVPDPRKLKRPYSSLPTASTSQLHEVQTQALSIPAHDSHQIQSAPPSGSDASRHGSNLQRGIRPPSVSRSLSLSAPQYVSKAFFCPVDWCGSFYRHQNYWKHHLQEHMANGELHQSPSVSDIMNLYRDVFPEARAEDDGAIDHFSDPSSGANLQFAYTVPVNAESLLETTGFISPRDAPQPPPEGSWSRPSTGDHSHYSGPPSSRSASPPGQLNDTEPHHMEAPPLHLQDSAQQSLYESPVASNYPQGYDYTSMGYQQDGGSLETHGMQSHSVNASSDSRLTVVTDTHHGSHHGSQDVGSELAQAPQELGYFNATTADTMEYSNFPPVSSLMDQRQLSHATHASPDVMYAAGNPYQNLPHGDENAGAYDIAVDPQPPPVPPTQAEYFNSAATAQGWGTSYHTAATRGNITDQSTDGRVGLPGGIPADLAMQYYAERA